MKMPSWIAKQPNGNYCRFSTIVDAICEYDGGRDWWWTKLRDEGGVEYANKKLEDADNEMGTVWEQREKHEPLYRWDNAVSNMIFHFRIGQSSSSKENIVKIITECGDDPERWADEFAKPVEDDDGGEGDDANAVQDYEELMES